MTSKKKKTPSLKAIRLKEQQRLEHISLLSQILSELTSIRLFLANQQQLSVIGLPASKPSEPIAITWGETDWQKQTGVKL